MTDDSVDELADTPGGWPVVDSTDLHRDDWVVALRRDRIRPPGDAGAEPFGRLVVEHPGAAMILAIDERDGVEQVCLIRQYRHPGGGIFVELPAGICDVPGEDPVETAKRELREEVSLEAAEWQHLLTSYPSVGITSEVHHLYVARGLRAVDTDYVAEHEEAHLEVVWAPLSDVLDAVLDGRIMEGPVAIAVLAYAAVQSRS
ncbi:NUDIX hydrolase [Nocardioides silvaticus]|uniref:NUDIX hydrolase n=1 Tax=Nocardioides silvaticus TaxID=2201891 RepID=A0A316THE9_9ACTN|nr:NUDIX hydrolase [Nocardioides silvaticus]PWN03993.1 NUDIX hydrolase [Nocardioides silvaticus]